MTDEISQFPPGITANRQHIHGGVIFEFEHERLGSIGRLTLFAQGSARTQVSVDVAPGDPDDPLWEERFELLSSVALTCLSPFGVSVPLSGIEEAKAAARLYRQFTQIRHRQQMWDFARGLAEEDYTRLLAMATLSVRGAAPADALDLRQRLSLLQKFRQAEPEERPDLLDDPLSEQGMRLVLRRKISDQSERKQT